MIKYMIEIQYLDNLTLSNQHKFKYLYINYSGGQGSIINFADMLAQEYIKNPWRKRKTVKHDILIELDGNFGGTLPLSMFKSARLHEWVKDENAVNGWGQLTGGKWATLVNLI